VGAAAQTFAVLSISPVSNVALPAVPPPSPLSTPTSMRVPPPAQVAPAAIVVFVISVL
jgi:hypothetical protein